MEQVMSKEISFESDTLTVDKPNKYSQEFRVTADVDALAVLEQFNAKEIIQHKDKDELLEEIGEAYAREYFSIKAEAEEPF
jgi:hypothetical protein